MVFLGMVLWRSRIEKAQGQWYCSIDKFEYIKCMVFELLRGTDIASTADISLILESINNASDPVKQWTRPS